MSCFCHVSVRAFRHMIACSTSIRLNKYQNHFKLCKYVWIQSHYSCVVTMMLVRGHEDWWARCWLTCPERNDLLLSFITPTCFFTLGLFYSLSSLLSLWPSFKKIFHLAEHIFQCCRTLSRPCSPTPLSGRRTWAPAHNAVPLPPAKPKQTSFLHPSSDKELALPFNPPSRPPLCHSCLAFHLQLVVAGFALINCREFSTQSWGVLTDQAKAPWHHWCERRF